MPTPPTWLARGAASAPRRAVPAPRRRAFPGALIALAALGALAGAPGPAASQQPAGSGAPAATVALPSQNDPRPSARAAPRTGSIDIDGRLGEAAWAAAAPITDLRQQQPDEGAPPTQRTELRILYDADAVYVGARMFDSSGARGVRAVMARRDALITGNGSGSSLTSDKIAVVFDTFRDKNGRTWFEVNPLGVRGEHQNGDNSYDPVWQAAANIDSLGWTAEMRIPYSQLRFPRGAEQLWGMQVWRTIDRRNEQDMWAFWRLNESGGPAYFGTLDGITVPGQPRQLEVVPYATSRATVARPEAGDPYRSSVEGRYDAGADIKYNVTTNLTLDATINPDFGQVEVDPALVNLSAFEVFFQERRPFFVANSQYFSFGSFNCFFCSNVSNLGVLYSRRIGRPPQLVSVVADRAEYMDADESTAILGAAKVTGRTRNGFTVGVLDALTSRETARYRPTGDGPGLQPELEQEIEPLSNYLVGRVRKDYRAGATRVGTIATLVNRRLGDTAEVARLRSHGALVGVDLDHRWSDRRYSLLAQAAVSDVGGDTAAIRRTQESSAHFYQRPDRRVAGDGLFDAGYDPARTSLRGYGFYARVAKDAGDWLWETSQNWRSPGFEVNDAGAMSRADYKWMHANVARSWSRPRRWYRNMFALVGGQQQFNYDGDRNDGQGQAYFEATLPNWWNLRTFVIHHPSNLDERLTRGGPTVKRYGYDFGIVGLSTDQRRRAVLGLETNVSRPRDNDEGGRVAFYPSVTFKPSPRVLVQLQPSYDRDFTPQQYVTAVDDPLAPAGFDGRRYVFARIQQRTLSMNTRLNTTFTPNLTLELFAQPFLASGRYTSFKEFAETRSLRMTRYGVDAGSTFAADSTSPSGHVERYVIDPDGAGPSAPFTVDNPDFNFRSLRGTAVLRWEYRPGSTLFLVWSQQRSGSDAFGDFDFARDRAALFRDRATNVLQLKATYWLGR